MNKKRVVLIDNYDSFTYNLVEYFKLCGSTVQVFRNLTPVEEISNLNFDLLILSPGPSVPSRAGQLIPILQHFTGRASIFGICLGLEAMIEGAGGSLRFIEPAHGKASTILNDQKTIYQGLPEKFEVGRYHSLVTQDLPQEYEVSALTDNLIMSIRHRQFPMEAVQYHPESILTMAHRRGLQLIENVLRELT